MSLLDITTSIQNISEAIASVLKVEVTVVDRQLNRVAGTGCYRERIGEKVDKDSVFGVALRDGESFIVENAGQHTVCLQCKEAINCREYAHVCCPIKVQGQVTGVIGLIAFQKEQRDAILINQENLMDFLNKMAELISAKLIEQESTDKIKLLLQEIEVVLDSVDKGIIATDNFGRILRYNKNALQFFGVEAQKMVGSNIKDLITNFSFPWLIREGQRLRNKEFYYYNNDQKLRGFFDANTISIDNQSWGIIFTFSKLSDVLSVVNDITTGTIITGFNEIIGVSSAFREAKLAAQRASQSTSTVLIQGESGTGKELFARAIHFQSKRTNNPFIPINCAAIPEQLLESELFGYEEGGFTGAKKGGKEGKFQLANGGTIFLDEIGDMPLHLQAKLLRVLQEQSIEKIGGKEAIPIDVRVIAATNKDLDRKVLEGEFREDLFYRINVIPLQIPPLRIRKEDIVILVSHLLKKCNKKLDKDIREIDTTVLNIFSDYSWPGNVRELENTIEYAVNMCTESIIKTHHLPKRLLSSGNAMELVLAEKFLPLKDLEKREIQKALSFFATRKGGINEAATALGVSRATLYRKIKEYDIKLVSN